MSPAERRKPTGTPLVSVIVPVFNVEKYLASCLDSVVAQTYPDWEAIVVIDGSEDDSETIARRYQQRDSRFRVISVPNGGLGSARNVGLDEASGEYVFFLDSDDLLPADALRQLVDAARTSSAPLVVGYAEDFYEDGATSRYWTQRADVFDRGAKGETVTTEPSLLEDHVVWNKLYRRSLLDGIRFPVQVHCEDIVFSARVALRAPRISVVPRLVYRHRRHSAAISADYLRGKTLRDWLEQGTIALTTVLDEADTNVSRHYFRNFVRGQWWTRAGAIERIESLQDLRGIEEISALLVRGLGPEPARTVGSWFALVLTFLAEGRASERWWRADLGVLNPWHADPHARPEDSVECALSAIDCLDPQNATERALGAWLLRDRVLQLVSDAVLSGEEAEESVIDRVINRIDAFISEPAELHPRERVKSLIPDEGTPRVELSSIHVEARRKLLRGTLTNARGMSAVDRAELRIPGGRRERTVPLWWGHVAPGARTVAWQAAVPVEADISSSRRAIEARFHRETGWSRWEPLRRMASAGSDAGEVARDVEISSGTGSARSTVVLPERVFTFPFWTSNPYMQMLHFEARAANVVMDGTADVEKAIGELHDPEARGVIHIHWPSPITEEAETAEEAERRVTAFLKALGCARSRGRAVLWTVHNVLPHDTLYHNAAIRLHQGLADLADRVHVLNSRTADMVSVHYVIPDDKIVRIPHASYHGVYGARIPRAEARASISADPDTVGVLHFGQLRPYKGLRTLIEVMADLSGRRGDLELLIAGKPAPGAWPLLDSLHETGIKATVGGEYVRDEDVAVWFSAADVVVLPYLKVLNSGTMHLAATYGVPVILPDEWHLRADYGEEPWVRFFNTNDPVDSMTTLVEGRWYLDHSVREAARAFARHQLPTKMARAYLDLLGELSTRPSGRRN